MRSKTKEDAEFYRLALEAGICPVEEAIVWCDAVIMEEAEPDLAIIEASLKGSSGTASIAKALREVEGDFDKIVVLRRLFHYMHDLLVRDRRYGYRIGVVLMTMASNYDYDSGTPDIDWSDACDIYAHFDMPEEMAEDYRIGRTIVNNDEVALMLGFLKREGQLQSSES
jgi:hypothetical protein